MYVGTYPVHNIPTEKKSLCLVPEFQPMEELINKVCLQKQILYPEVPTLVVLLTY